MNTLIKSKNENHASSLKDLTKFTNNNNYPKSPVIKNPLGK